MTTRTIPVLNLGYLGVSAPRPEEFRSFGTEIIGCEVRDGTDGSVLLKTDDRAYRVAVHPTDTRGNITYLGFEVQGPVALKETREILDDHGVDYEVVTGEQAYSERKVAELVRMTDPSNVTVEVFWGHERDYEFTSPLGVSEFVTGEQGLGHAVVCVGDLDASVKFYTEVFGFLISDISVQNNNRTIFLRCGSREHSLAMLQFPPEKSPRLHHFMFEVGELDDVGKGYDRVIDAGVQLTLTLGKHTNDSMVSFYCRTPGGYQMEYGWSGKQMEPNAAATTMTKGDVWGHRFVESGKSVNDLIKKS
ncbi:VOC family protein [Nocardia sp. NPDC050799]|uniref:VOC family protein n=1 Tax=Nocardia sp. NPDC050799 TaxID=3154842 RepID=UPI0033D67CC5